MNLSWKIIFWLLTIGLGFVSPVISFGLIVLYYLPNIIKFVCQECEDVRTDSKTSENNVTINYSDEYSSSKKIDEFSKETLEDMK